MTGSAPWDLPSDWTWRRFGEVARVASHLVDPAPYGDWPHIAPNHIESQTGRLLPHTTIAADGVSSAKHLFEPGQILYSKIRPYLAKVAIAEVHGLCSADMYPIESDLNERYLKWWMLSREFTSFAIGEQARTVLPKINKRSLYSLPVPVAPAANQRQIAERLEHCMSHLDAAALTVNRALRRVTALENSVLAAAYRSDRQEPLGSLADIQGGIQKQPGREPGAGAVPFLRVANVTRDGLDLGDVHRIKLFGRELERLRLQAGDLLVVEGNGSASQIGRAALWHGEIENCVHQNHLIRVRATSLNPAYLAAIWNSPQNRQRLTSVASSSSGLHTLSVSKLKALEVPVRPTAEQKEIVKRVDEMRWKTSRLRSEIERATGRSSQVRDSLLHAAFSGQLSGAKTSLEPLGV